MKTFLSKLVVCCALLVVVPACHRDCDYSGNWDEGSILGPDYRECACCGGYFIKIGGDTLRTPVLPDDLELTDVFPVPVRLRWEADPTPCLGDEIIVFDIERR